MKLKELPKLLELPPEEHPLGVYAGMAVGGLILGASTIILLREILSEFAGGINLTQIVFIKFILMILSAFASFACFGGLFRMVALQRMQVKKVDKEFKDFIMYARPLIEEVIHQRIVGQKLLKELEKLQMAIKIEESKMELNRYNRGGGGGDETKGSLISKWDEFLLFVALLSSISIGLFIYLEKHPWELVPYSIIILASAWWLVIAKLFGTVRDLRSYYLPALFILIVPSLSVALRAVIEPYQALYVTFVLLFLYVISMYLYSKYVIVGKLPDFLTPVGREKELQSKIPPVLNEYLPERELVKPDESRESSLLKKFKEAIFTRSR